MAKKAGLSPLAGALLGGAALTGGAVAVAKFVPIPVDTREVSGFGVRVVTHGFSVEQRSMLYAVQIREPTPQGFAPRKFEYLKDPLGRVVTTTTATGALALGLEHVSQRAAGVVPPTDTVPPPPLQEPQILLKATRIA